MNFSLKILGFYKFGEYINLCVFYVLGYKVFIIKEFYYNYIGVIGGGVLIVYYGNIDLKV